MSLWELQACIAGWSRAHGPGDDEPPDMDEEDYIALLAAAQKE